MDALGKYLFARARLPLDEDVVVPGGHLPGQFLGLHQSGGGADEVGQGIPGVGAGALHLRQVLQQGLLVLLPRLQQALGHLQVPLEGHADVYKRQGWT